MLNLAKLIKKNFYVIALVGLCILYILITYQSAFSERSLVGNLGPFPDVFHYVLPAKCFIEQFSWTLCRPGLTGLSAEVGPLYSISLIPVFLLNSDPRMFYYTNLFLGLVSIISLYVLLYKITKNSLISGAIGLLAVTSYHLTWFPSLAMAENLLIPLYVIAILLCITPQSTYFKKFLPLAAVSFALTKFAYIPLTGIFLLYWLYRMVHKEKVIPEKLAVIGIVIAAVIASWYGLIKTDLGTYFFVLQPSEEQLQSSWFSLSFLPHHIKFYLQAITAQPILVIWDTRPLMSITVSVLGVFGYLSSFFNQKFREFSIVVLSSIIGQLLFISTFYATDARYFIIVLPALLIGCGLSFVAINNKFKKPTLVTIAFIALSLITVGFEAPRLRERLAINFKYSETPWFYIATKQIDQSLPNQENVVLISAIPVYFFDFFAEKNYLVLPLAPEQEANKKEIVYGPEYNYDNLIDLFQKQLDEGKAVYISNYGLGNQPYMHEAYERIEQAFNFNLVKEGCHQACNTYQLTSVESSQ